MLLKREIGPKIVANWSGRGRRLRASWERFLGRGVMASILQKKSAWIWLQISLKETPISAAIFATSAPRSGHNRDASASSIACRSIGDESSTIPRQKSPRSRLDRTAIVEFFHDVPPPFDGNPALWRGPRVFLVVRRSASNCLEAILPLKLPDRGLIVPRSRFDWTAIVEFFHETSEPSDETSGEWTVRSRSSGIPFWWRSDAPRVATWRQVSTPITST